MHIDHNNKTQRPDWFVTFLVTTFKNTSRPLSLHGEESWRMMMMMMMMMMMPSCFSHTSQPAVPSLSLSTLVVLLIYCCSGGRPTCVLAQSDGKPVKHDNQSFSGPRLSSLHSVTLYSDFANPKSPFFDKAT